MRDSKPRREHTHLTWPSVHAVFTSFGPYESLQNTVEVHTEQPATSPVDWLQAA